MITRANSAHGADGAYSRRVATLIDDAATLRAQVAEAAGYVARHVDEIIPDSSSTYVLEDGVDVTIHVDRMGLATVEVRTEILPRERG